MNYALDSWNHASDTPLEIIEKITEIGLDESIITADQDELLAQINKLDDVFKVELLIRTIKCHCWNDSRLEKFCKRLLNTRDEINQVYQMT